MQLASMPPRSHIINQKTNTMTTPTIDQPVERTGSTKDYATGRKGIVVEINTDVQRARVLWTEESNGEKINIRTWVHFKFLKPQN